jgi:hypothetical protein
MNRSKPVSLQVSCAVLPIDVATGQPPARVKPKLTVKGAYGKVLHKQDGTLIVIGLSADLYSLQVEAPHYSIAAVSVDTHTHDVREPLVVPLIPMPSMSFAPGTTLLRVALRRNQTFPEGCHLRAAITDEGLPAGKLAEASKGSLSFTYTAGTKLTPGCSYYLLDSTTSKREFVRIARVDTVTRTAWVQEPLLFEHPKGTLLTETAEGMTDRRGECAAAFPSQRKKQFTAMVELEWNGNRSVLFEEVMVEEGRTTQLEW